MAIILEGMDNSGKSSLAERFNYPVLHPGPRPKSEEEVLACLVDQAKRAGDTVIMDRITAISHVAYGYESLWRYRDFLDRMIRTPNCIMIYCRPSSGAIKDFSRHKTKSYDDTNKLEWLQVHADRIINNYDLIMSGIPHLKYDYMNPDRDVINQAILAMESFKEWESWIKTKKP